MSSVNVTHIDVLDNPANFTDPYRFQITFECVKELSADLEWKLTYVGSAETEECDQELDSVLVGPVPLGINQFVFEAPAPDHHKIPKQDLLGVTVCLISCLYQGKEFIRVGYYVNNEYDDPDSVLLSAEEGMDIEKSEDEEEEDEEEEEDNEGEDEDDDEDGPNSGADEGQEAAAQAGPEGASPERVDSKGLQQPQGPADSETTATAMSPASPDAGDSSGKVRKMDVDVEDAEGVSKKQKQKHHSEEGGSAMGPTANEPGVAVAGGEEQGDQPMGGQSESQVCGRQAGVPSTVLPPKFSVDRIRRHILDKKPRITRFLIDWD